MFIKIVIEVNVKLLFNNNKCNRILTHVSMASYMAKILPIRRKTLFIQSFNQNFFYTPFDMSVDLLTSTIYVTILAAGFPLMT